MFPHISAPPIDWTDLLLSWYDKNRRILPWRHLPHETIDPYRIWLSEIMLQQTTVITVIPYFEKFMRLWPTIYDLAIAHHDTVMYHWAGLGYYARARHLLKTAHIIVTDYRGQMPCEEHELLKLPGIGTYTAAAIMAIAFNKKSAPVDGNIERVLSRIYAIDTLPPKLNTHIRNQSERIIPENRSGDFAQALMDLGANICTPQNPHCIRCPLCDICKAYTQNKVDTLPRRLPKKRKPKRLGVIYWLENKQRQILMIRNPKKGLLGDMLMFPSTGWDKNNDTNLPKEFPNIWSPHEGKVTHIFTHFHLTLTIQKAYIPEKFTQPIHTQWVHIHEFNTKALPTVMKKVVSLLLKNQSNNQ